jgi:hypothetical protein
MTDVAGIAAEVVTVDERIMKLLPTIAMFAGFIPGGAVVSGFEPLILEVLMAVDEAAKAVAAGNPGAAFSVVLDEIKNHLTPGKPNSPILSAPALIAVPAADGPA